jgi:hypothetical protein
MLLQNLASQIEKRIYNAVYIYIHIYIYIHRHIYVYMKIIQII